MFNMTPEIQAIQAWTRAAFATIQDSRREERGAVDLATVVILTALFAAAAIAIAAIVINKFTDKANSIPTG